MGGAKRRSGQGFSHPKCIAIYPRLYSTCCHNTQSVKFVARARVISEQQEQEAEATEGGGEKLSGINRPLPKSILASSGGAALL
jgi:hypothetical protein